MKKLNLVAVIGVVVVALGLLATVVFKTTGAGSANDMSDLLPKPRTGVPKAPMNPVRSPDKSGRRKRRTPASALRALVLPGVD